MARRTRTSSNIYYGLLPSISALQITQPVSFASSVPRSYHRSSDEPESQSRGGGGGRSSPPNQGSQGVPYDVSPTTFNVTNVGMAPVDVPYIPRRDHPTDYQNFSRMMNQGFATQQSGRPLMMPPDMPLSQPDYGTIEQAQNMNLGLPHVMDTQLQASYPPVHTHNTQTYPITPHVQQSYTGDRIMPFSFPQQVRPGSTTQPLPAPRTSRPTPPPTRSRPTSSSSSPASSYQSPQSSMENVVSLHPSAFEGATNNQLPDPGEFLRLKLGLKPGEPVTLWSLPDPEPGSRPPHSYPLLVRLAIYGSPNHRLTLKQIYEAIEERFEFYRNDPRGAWKGSIRHNLSLNQVFRNVHRPLTEPGKGNYWEIDHSKGEGYKRDRKRKSRKGKSSSKGKPEDEDEEDDFLSSNGDDEEIDLASIMENPGFTYSNYQSDQTVAGSSHRSRASTSRAARRTSPYSAPSSSTGPPQSRIASSSSPRLRGTYLPLDPQAQHPYDPSIYDMTQQPQPRHASPLYNQFSGHAAATMTPPDQQALPSSFPTSSPADYLSIASMRVNQTPSLAPPEHYFGQFTEGSSPEGSQDYTTSPSYGANDDNIYIPSDPRGKRRRG